MNQQQPGMPMMNTMNMYMVNPSPNVMYGNPGGNQGYNQNSGYKFKVKWARMVKNGPKMVSNA